MQTSTSQSGSQRVGVSAEQANLRAGCRVVVVEDDPASRNALVMLLRHFGFDTADASTVAEALALLTRVPTAVVLDLMLPDGNGSTVLEHVRNAGLATRVAIATGAGDWRSMVDEARLRPDAVFLKPLDFPRLVGWLDETCRAAN